MYLNEALKQSEYSVSTSGWVYGRYVLEAIGSSFSKRAKYPAEPYGKPVEVQPDEESHTFNDADRFFVFAEAFNKSFESKKKKQ